MTFEQAKDTFGAVTFGGVEYALIADAYVDNYGTDGGVRYYAKAINADAIFIVSWETTSEWDASNAIVQAEMQGKDVVMEEIAEEYGVPVDFVPYDLSSVEYACDWRIPVDVRAV